jgi:chromosome partitioning protein
MDFQGYSSMDLHYLFRMEERFKSQQVLANAESRGEIPKANRIARGKKEVRKWTTEQLPEIGRRFGFIPNRKVRRQVISVFTQKGGTLKTTFSHAFARVLALHGIRVIVVGLDIQGSITKTMLPPPANIDTLADILAYNKGIKGLYHFFNQPEKYRRIEEVIHKTDLPTLDIIPETPQLNDLILLINQKTLREFRFRDELLPQLEKYDVVLFDNGPSWNSLVENSLASSNTLIQPIGCDVGTFQVLDGNMAQIEDFRVKAKITWDSQLLIPTLRENTKLSQQILGAYLAQYPARQLLTNSIRKSVTGQEALYLNRSAIEHDPRSDLSDDYANVVREIWERVCSVEQQKTLAETPSASVSLRHPASEESAVGV